MSDCVFVFDNSSSISIPCNDQVGSVNSVIGQVVYADYGYLPTAWVAYVFVTLFGIAWLAYVYMSFRLPYKAASSLMCAGVTVECIGWGGRIWSNYSWYWESNYGGLWSDNGSSFIMQEVCLVIAPVFFSATNYILLARIISMEGGHYSTIHPKSISIILMICDWVCLLVQAGGGAWAGTALTSAGSDRGAKLMSAGVIVQLVVTLVFCSVLFEYVWRRQHYAPVLRQYNPCGNWRCGGRGKAVPIDTPTRSLVNEKTEQAYPSAGPTIYTEQPQRELGRFKLAISVICWSTLLIMIRSIFRSVELLNGWQGKFATNQILFCVLDALLMCVCGLTYTVLPPPVFLR